MTVPVRYDCPRCGAIATLDRDPYMADKSVTPVPLEGWTYAAPDEDGESADGGRLVCGEHTDEELFSILVCIAVCTTALVAPTVQWGVTRLGRADELARLGAPPGLTH